MFTLYEDKSSVNIFQKYINKILAPYNLEIIRIIIYKLLIHFRQLGFPGKQILMGTISIAPHAGDQIYFIYLFIF